MIYENAEILDNYFRDCFESSEIGPRLGLVRNPYAIVAIGGYGRGEQCLRSDVDILFLFEKNVPTAADELIREIVYPLWDAGYEIGHATRSLSECVKMARSDLEVLTSLLDARIVSGQSHLYLRLMAMMREKVLGKNPAKVINLLVSTNQARHKRYGDSTYLLEPNLKDGQGGLRDYHTMLWIARIRSGAKEPRDLEYYGFLSHEEYQELEEALHFIWKVRNHLHHLSGRKNDQLHFEHQIQLAKTLKYKSRKGQQPVEHFLGDLHAKMELVKEQHLMFLYEQGLASTLSRKRTQTKRSKYSGLIIERDRLGFRSPEDIVDAPLLLIRIFEESVRLKVPLSGEAKRLVRDFAHLIDDLADMPAALRSFEQILSLPATTFNVLNEMLLTGFLPRYIPQFQPVVHLIQYDEYHLYPVDKHSLRTVQVMKAFATDTEMPGHDLYRELYNELPNRKLLLWGGLLHDIAKGQGTGDHSGRGAKLVQEILSRKGYRSEDIDTVAFLVREHLLLMKTATRRDLNDEETALYCAGKIQDIQRLKLLFLLTVADAKATGPAAWTEWTSVVLRSLFIKILKIMEHGELASGEALQVTAAKKEKLLTEAADGQRADIESLLTVMSPRYLLYTPAKAIGRHVALHRDLQDKPFVWQIDTDPDSDTRTVTICARNCPGLLSRICGLFTLNSINILGVEAFSWRNNIALDIFRVSPPPDRIFEQDRWQRTHDQLTDALNGTLDIAATLRSRNGKGRPNQKSPPSMRPNNVHIDNESSSFFTIIEVFSQDFPGLLFQVADAMFRNQLDIWIAKVATGVDQVVDVFYVRDFDGQKVDVPEKVEEIKTALFEAIAEPR